MANLMDVAGKRRLSEFPSRRHRSAAGSGDPHDARLGPERAFDQGCALVAATYHAEVHVLANIIDITPKPERKRRRG
jgi:hypothetical protein